MKVIVDTSVWSLALRRHDPDLAIIAELKSLIEDQRAAIMGPIRQELLSGYSDRSQFDRLRDRLQFFVDEPILSEDFITAATFSNQCRSNGIQGSHTDFLICACAYRLTWQVFTTDKDFQLYAQHLPFDLYATPQR